MSSSGDGVAGLIEEYLQYFGFSQTLKCLKDERRKSRNVDQGSPSTGIASLFTQAFNKGDCVGFFSLWDKHIPGRTRRDDPTARKLAFYCQVHFAIYPLKGSNPGSTAASMKRFRGYLETAGLELSQTPEFLPFYALPFVDNAKDHPTFKELLGSKWESEVRSRMSKFVQAVLKQQNDKGSKLPALLGIVERHRLGADPQPLEDSSLQSNLRERVNRYEAEMMDAKRKCMETQMCAHGLLKVTYELLQTLERASKGDYAIDTNVLRMHFTEVSKQAEFLGAKGALTAPSASTHKPAAYSAQPAPVDNNSAVPTVTQTLAPLSHSKLSTALAQSDDYLRCRLLQALRWRLSRSQKATRKGALSDFIEGDILQLHKPAAPGSCVQLLGMPDLLTREYVARLLNAVAAEKEGRSYLTSKDSTLCSELVHKLQALEATDDGLLKQNLLGTLVKLSLLRQPQTQMINMGMLPWVIQQLGEIETLSEYSQECAAALLMNLSLRTAGKAACEQPELKVIRVLSDLLEHESMGLRTYINGTLYSLLTRPKLREEAQALGLEDMLKTLDLADEDFARQIRYIQQQLHSDALDAAESDVNEEDDEEEEDEDDMEEEEESLETDSKALVGEQLLCAEYLEAPNAVRGRPVVKRAAPSVKSPAVRTNALQQTLPRPSTPGVAQAVVGTPFQQQPKPNQQDSASKQPSPSSLNINHSVRAPMPDEETIEKVKAKMSEGSGAEDMSAEFVQAFEMRSKIVRTPL